MKQNRRRRHLRPRPTRSQVNQQIEHVRSAIQLFQMEALLEAHNRDRHGSSHQPRNGQPIHQRGPRSY